MAQIFDADMEDGLEFTSSDTLFSFRINPVLQNQFVYNGNLTNSDSEIYFRNRRTRFYFYGHIFDPKLTYKIQLRFESNNQNLYDAAFKYQATPSLSFWFGQETLPAARSQLISLKYLQFVDRSVIHSVFDLQKDVGIWAFYKANVGKSQLKLSGAISNGEGIFRGVNTTGYSYTGRIDLLPFGAFAANGDVKGSDLAREQTPKLALGVAYNFNDEANANRGQRGVVFPSDITTDISSLYIDGIFKYRGFSTMAELIIRDTPDPILSNIVPVFDGYGIAYQAGYLLESNYEIAVRYAGLFPSESIKSEVPRINEYTIGLSKYFRQHNFKLQGDITYQDLYGIQEVDHVQARLQMTLNF